MKKKRMNRSFFLMLTVIMILTAVPAELSRGLLDISAFAESSGKCGTSLYWKLDSGGNLSVTGTDEMTDYASSADVPWYSEKSKIKTVTLSEGVTTVGAYAFEGCTAITKVTLPGSIVSLGKRSFYGCTGLRSLSIPQGMRAIGNSAFENCTALSGVNLPDSVTTLGSFAFSSCTNISSVKTGNGLTVIDLYAFRSCRSLSSLTIGERVEKIGNYAFSGCESLTSVFIPDSVTEINNYAFSGCSSLLNVTGGKFLKVLGLRAFSSCGKLTGTVSLERIEKIGMFAFDGTAIYNNDSNWKDDVLYIGSNLIKARDGFPDNYSIKEGTRVIADGAFESRSSLSAISLCDGLKTIGERAFYDCRSLKSVTVPDSVTKIGQYAFYQCDKLTDVVIGSGVSSIEALTFNKCSALSNVTISDTADHIDKSAFSETKLYSDENYRENGVLYIGNHLIDANGDLTAEHGPYTVREGTVTVADSAFKDNTSIINVIMPEGVRAIGASAFSGCSALRYVTVPDSLTRIGAQAFSGTAYYNDDSNWDHGLLYIGDHLLAVRQRYGADVVIKDGTLTVADSAFSGNIYFTNVTVPESVRTIGASAFEGCTGLTSVCITDMGKWCGIRFANAGSNPASLAGGLYLNGEIVSDVVIPDGVLSVSDFAFYNCGGITGVTIPGSVSSVGASAFYGCYGIDCVSITDVGAWCGIRFADRYSNPLFYGNDLILNGEPLTNLLIPEQTVSIGDYAFCKCLGITSVTVPESLDSVGEYAFYECTGITGVYASDLSCWCNISFTDIYSNPLKYAGSLFIRDELLTELTVPDGVSSIRDNAFCYLGALKSVTLHDGITSIGSYAFRGCAFLKKIIIPPSVSFIGKDAFLNDTSLHILCYKGSEAERYVLENGTSYRIINQYGIIAQGTSLSLSWKLYYTGELKVSGNGRMTDYSYYSPAPWNKDRSLIEKVTVEKGLANIGNYAFANSSIKEITIQEGLISIGEYAFNGCTKLTSVNIPDSVKTIGDRAFLFCESLSEVVIGSGVTSIGPGTFYNCTALSLVCLSANVTEIDINAFYQCENLCICAPSGSYAERFCLENDITFIALSELRLSEGSPYSLNDGYVSGINPFTEIDDLMNGFSSAVTVTDAGGAQIVSGYICTGYSVSSGNESVIAVVKGDINGDGETDSNDAFSALRYDTCTIDLYGAYLLAGDVDGDEEVDSNDAMFILKIDSGTIDIEDL